MTLEDFLDPGNLFHKSRGEKLADAQWEWQKEKYEQNYENQEKWTQKEWDQSIEAYNYQKLLNQTQMEREDTAVQRRVADLKAAGISPTLAAGSPASATPVHAGSVASVNAPQYQVGENPKLQMQMFKEQMQKDRLALAMSLMGNIADVSRTKAETEFIKKKGEYQDIFNKYADETLKEKLEGIGLKNDYQVIANDTARLAYEFNIEANPEKIKHLQIETSKLGKQLEILGFDKEIRYNEKLASVYYEAKARFERDLAEQNVSVAKLKAENIDFDTACKAYTLTYAYERGIPLNGLNQWQVIYDVMDRIEKLFGNRGKPSTYGGTEGTGLPAPGTSFDYNKFPRSDGSDWNGNGHGASRGF